MAWIRIEDSLPPVGTHCMVNKVADWFDRRYGTKTKAIPAYLTEIDSEGYPTWKPYLFGNPYSLPNISHWQYFPEPIEPEDE